MTNELQTVLIVDDEAAIRKLIFAKFSSAGYSCLEAGNAAQAVDILNVHPVSLVILDVKMPGKPGTELLPEIKERFPDTAVIMATAMADVSTAITCMQHGAYDYITKPFDLDDLVHSVGRAMEKRRLELENKEFQEHLQDKVTEQACRIRASFFNAIGL